MVFIISNSIHVTKFNQPISKKRILIFQCTASDQVVNIPTDLSGSVNIKCWGAGGATQGYGADSTGMYQTGYGGGGGYTEAEFTNASMVGKTLTIIVGQGGFTVNASSVAPATYGGGGSQSCNDPNWGAASGGGRSAVRIPGNIEIITAGGGGAGGGCMFEIANRGSGGAGGGYIGVSGEYSTVTPTPSGIYGGGAGNQTSGGPAGTNNAYGPNPTPGSQYTGGNGAQFGCGAGGGYYGGGGGALASTSQSWIFGGGGGGSSYVNTTYGTLVQILQGSGNLVAGSSYLPSGFTNIGYGGAAKPGTRKTNGNPGSNGLVVITYSVA